MRLIDADAFKDWLLNRFMKPQDTLVLTLQGFIAEQPTAYDIDKVVEELKQRSKEYNSGVRLHGKPEEMLTNEAIEIVKHGGVSDDVCEWHCDEYGRYHTECHYLADNDPLEYTYCPCCGKKILCKE